MHARQLAAEPKAPSRSVHSGEREQDADHAAATGNYELPPVGELGHPGFLPAAIHRAISGSGTLLPGRTDVRLHTGVLAHRAASALGAQAFTVGRDVAFGLGRYAPGTSAGDALIRHELAHVGQQAHSGLARLDCKPDPAYQKLDERIKAAATDIFPEHRQILNKLRELADAVEAGDKATVTRTATEFITLDKSGLDPATAVLLDEVPEVLVSRIYLLDLQPLARALEQHFFVNRSSAYRQVAWHGKATTTRYTLLRDVVELVKTRAKLGTAAEAEQAIDTALLAFKLINSELESIDLAAVVKEREEARRDAVASAGSIDRLSGLSSDPASTTGAFYSGLLSLLPDLAIIMQRAFQVIMNVAIADLEQGKQPQDALKRARKVLGEKISPEITKFGKLVDEFNKGKMPEEGITEYPANREVEVTRSDFDSPKKRHLDYEDRSRRSPSVAISSFEKGDTYFTEKKLELRRTFEIRADQINTLESLFGANKAAAVSPGFKLHDVDSWRAFLLKNFRSVQTAKGDWEALVASVSLLQKYLFAFTLRTPYNIDEFGDNYLSRTFPKALTGQLIHDCGVYALRAAYALSLIREAVKPPLRFRAVILPIHVGLIITFGDDISKGAVYLNNNQIDVVPGAKLQALAKVWQTTAVVQPPPVDGKTQPRQRKDQPAVPLDVDALHTELATASFATGIDMPAKLAEVPKSGKPGEDKAGKQALWDFYHREVVKTQTVQAVAGEAQPELRYLRYFQRGKELHNNVRVPIYNKAFRLWLDNKASLEQAETDLRSTDQDKQAAAREVMRKHALALETLFAPLRPDLTTPRADQDALTRTPATQLQSDVADPTSEFIGQNRGAIGKGAILQGWLRLGITRDADAFDYIRLLSNPDPIAQGTATVVPPAWDTQPALPKPVD